MEDLSEVEKLTVYPSGNYSVTGFWINLERKIMSHLLQIIMPSAMFVMVSWISFLMPIDGGERAGLLVTLFLVLVSMFLSVVSTAPRAQFLTAMEIWLVSCLVFVFLAVMEYGFNLRLMNKSHNKKLSHSPKNMLGISLDSTSTDRSSLNKKNKKIQALDKISIVVLPVLFIILNILFWMNYVM